MDALTALLLTLATPTTAEVREAIELLAPRHVPAARYARIVRKMAMHRAVHPLLVVAFIQVESAKSWNPRLVSRTNDYGLTQVHVAERGSARFLGREHELYDPATNVREWVRLAAMWRNYHQRKCEVRVEVCYSGPEGPWGCSMEVLTHSNHRWWAHLKWGYVVKNTEHADKVEGLLLWMLRRLQRARQPRASSSQMS